MRTLINLAIELETSLTITFIDVRDAFTSVSHALIKEALRDAGAYDKSIGMFRAIYSKAKGAVRVTGADGAKQTSRKFDINRGCMQGNLISPMYCTS